MNLFKYTQRIKDWPITKLINIFAIGNDYDFKFLYVATNSYRNERNDTFYSIKIGKSPEPYDEMNDMGMKKISIIKFSKFQNINISKLETIYHRELEKMLPKNPKAFKGKGKTEMFGKFSDPDEADKIAKYISRDIKNILKIINNHLYYY